MGSFLRENWLWIVAPIVVLMLALLSVIFLPDGGDDAGFIYNLF